MRLEYCRVRTVQQNVILPHSLNDGNENDLLLECDSDLAHQDADVAIYDCTSEFLWWRNALWAIDRFYEPES